MQRFLREPLLQFLLIGIALFVVHSGLSSGSPAIGGPAPAPAAATEIAPSSRQIVLTLDQLSGLALLFQSQWRREPTTQELDALVENEVKEEILYREGLALGLDKNDEIVRRRMAQKMQFLAEDVAAAHEPREEELRAWFAQNRQMFAAPARLSFRHLYFSPDLRGSRARADAEAALGRLRGQPEDAPLAASLADPFMYQDYYRDREADYLGKEFGPKFALAVEKLTAGSWQGPIESGYGWHLVFVDTFVPGRMPGFEEIEPEVKAAWLGAEKSRAVQSAYDELRAKYEVLLPALPPSTETKAAETAPASALTGSGEGEIQ